MRFKLFDVVAAVLSIAVVVGSGFFAAAGSGEAQQVVIQSDDGDFIYPIDDEREVHVTGPLGHTVVRIADGAVAVTASPCRDKICIAAGVLHSAGEWTACLPNRVFVRVSGADQEEHDIDAQSY